MKNPLVRRSALGLAAGALAVTGLSALPTPAGAAVEYAEVRAAVDFSRWDPEVCDISEPSHPGGIELVDNGVPVSQSWTAEATVTHTDDETDVTELSGSGQVTASMTPIGAGPVTIKASVAASASAQAELEDGACSADVNARPGAEAAFELPQPMWATISGSGDGTGAAQAMVGDMQDGVVALVVGPHSKGSVSALLPAGPVYVQIQAQAQADNDDMVGARSYAGSFTIELTPVGATPAPAGPGGAASPVSGKSKGVVALGARDCATGNVAVDLTKKAKKKAKQVTISVNGAKAAKLRGKKLKPRTIVLPAAKAAPAEVVVRIKLKSGKKATVRRSYQACS
ncbi:hypothetical protein RB608_19040 [Nocardioides sp. LHD-245]|uniref:hypothetical protein n=1 Tax=Nocardioides sp. LHD-245 TaxID=3051387 RepID=UPI0027E1734D|nr:hypothetical protein [Nocardioides sp. LHD-245]